MSFDPYEFDRDYGQSSRMESIGQYTAKTFLWMVLGLLVTFGIALLGWVTNATLLRPGLCALYPSDRTDRHHRTVHHDGLPH